MDKNLITKIISGEASKEETESYFDLISNDKEEERLFFETKELWIKSGAENPVDESFKNKGFNSFWESVTAERIHNRHKLRLQIIRYAAIALLLVGVGSLLSYVIINNQLGKYSVVEQKFVAEHGSLAHFELTDGTMIWLNSGSEMVYSQDKNGDRHVDLNGEAYFNVKHGKEHQFVVNAGDILIRDLGTVFNVKAYPQDQEVETTLLKGVVDIQKTNEQSVYRMKPGEHVSYSKSQKKLIVTKANTQIVSAWKDGKFAFQDQRLEQICHDLENWYDVKFVFKNQAIKNFKYSGVIKKATNVAYVLKMLTITTNIQYKIIENDDGPDEILIS